MGLSNSPAGGRSWNNIRPALPPPHIQYCVPLIHIYRIATRPTVLICTCFVKLLCPHFPLIHFCEFVFPCCLRLCLGSNPVPRMLVSRRAGDFSSVRETKSGTVLLKASLAGRRFKWPTKVRQPTRRRSSAPQSKSGGDIKTVQDAIQ